jgi:hypothetical protein
MRLFFVQSLGSPWVEPQPAVHEKPSSGLSQLEAGGTMVRWQPRDGALPSERCSFNASGLQDLLSQVTRKNLDGKCLKRVLNSANEMLSSTSVPFLPVTYPPAERGDR